MLQALVQLPGTGRDLKVGYLLVAQNNIVSVEDHDQRSLIQNILLDLLVHLKPGVLIQGVAQIRCI